MVAIVRTLERNPAAPLGHATARPGDAPPASARVAPGAFAELLAGRRPSTCAVIAELGVNHNGSADRAIALLAAARQAGADAAKLQFFVPRELCSRVYRADEIAELERLRLSDDDHARLVRAARDIGIPVFATPFDEPSLDLLCRLNIPAIKIGSGEITHTPFLTQVARTGRPVILSTGGCEWPDIDRAVATLRANGCTNLSLLHCVSAYPPPDDELNLLVIPALAARYPDCVVGFSDHTLGHEAALAAVALGARIIEKHLTLDCRDAGPDHAASADPASFAALVASIRRVERMLGDGEKRVAACEGIIGRSCVAARDLPAGHALLVRDIAFKRPGRGVRPYAVRSLIGRRTSHPVAADELIVESDVGPAD